ncbi:SRPBCC domain-containing protein [Cytophagaceae bacterium DM2B3-1]|uniref:SRPBCC domain-containing protein n=1 Tax=Xanthocytophaga flava TaxID=3048013 RepID=A0ABT7CH31_9BACT|nr:SRPBCC domain-containing protein [Xanthocytophaga flavus]MDJ1493046.1 SRPBCC domain-containing protein [Xanthocytophaga flavus]
MKNALLMDFTVDKDQNKIHVKRTFDTPLNKVWAAWTDSKLLDQWWAPKPWKAVTKSMEFQEGGYWLYAMVGPEGEKEWARTDYKQITPYQKFSAQDGFCDEQGTVNTSLPRSLWTNAFTEADNTTKVTIEISYDKLEDLESILQFGFQEGFTIALQELDVFLAKEK